MTILFNIDRLLEFLSFILLQNIPTYLPNNLKCTNMCSCKDCGNVAPVETNDKMVDNFGELKDADDADDEY